MMEARGKMAMLALTVVVVLLFWSELIFSSVPSLLRLGETAVALGWSTVGAGAYFVVLALLDGVGGVWALRVLRQRTEAAVRNLNLTLVLYGAFQLLIAFLLPPSLRFVYVGIGVVYALIGGIYGRFGRLIYG